MAEYFIYHLRKTWVRFAVFAAILCVLANASVLIKSRNGFDGSTNVSGNLIILAVFAMVAPVAMAGLEFSQFMNRRNLDTWFSLPISRLNLFLVHFLNGAGQLVVSLLAGTVVACAKLSPYPKFRLTEVWNFFWVAMGLMLLLYMLLTFLFVSANNVFDGCVFMLGSYMIPNAIFNIVRYFVLATNHETLLTASQETLTNWIINQYTLYMEIIKAGVRYSSSLVVSSRREIYTSYAYDFLEDYVEANIPNILIWTMICVAALAGAIFVFTRKKTEKVNGVSDSWFGYRILIPLVCAGYLTGSAASTASVARASFSNVLSLILPIPTFIGAFIAFIVFRRGIKLKISDLITMGALLLYYIVCVLIFKTIV